MQVSVQKFTRTTWPLSTAEPSGSELSHPVAPPNEGMCRRPKTAIQLAERPGRGGSTGPEGIRRSRRVSVRGQERGQRRQQLVGRLLGEPVAGVGNDDALHVGREERHLVADELTPA